MSKEPIDYTETQLREFFSKTGLNALEVERAIADYMRYRESELSQLSILSYAEIQTLGAEGGEILGLRDGKEIVVDILRDYLSYSRGKKEIAETYQESKDWVKVFSTVVYSDVNSSQEAFIDYIEETYQTKVKDAKHLQKLTGITRLDSWDVKARGYLPAKTEEEAKENALRELEETLIGARYSKYFRSIETALEGGAKYKDLLQIKPQDYGLPKTWEKQIGKDQYSSILWAISWEYMIDESLFLTPDLRTIAGDLEAPYSVLMDCYKLKN
jgi:hypothetical protein